MTASFSRRNRLLQYLPPAISHFTSVESHREQPCNTSLLRRQTRPHRSLSRTFVWFPQWGRRVVMPINFGGWEWETMAIPHLCNARWRSGESGLWQGKEYDASWRLQHHHHHRYQHQHHHHPHHGWGWVIRGEQGGDLLRDSLSPLTNSRVSADVTAASATTERTDDPWSFSALLSSFIRLQRGELRWWERTSNPHCRAASSATQRQRTRSQARSCHARPPTTLLRMCARTLVKGVLLLLLLRIISSKQRSKKRKI